jgi:N-methylhydantoinase A
MLEGSRDLMNDRLPYRIAVDIGGTFVDAVELDTRTLAVRLRKASTTPGQPWGGVLEALERLETPLEEVELFIHGTTLGLNAVLEHRGAPTGIMANEGLRDVFIIGRSNVPDAAMYDFQYEQPPPLVRRRDTVGVVGRLDYRGRELEPLVEGGVREAARLLVEQQGVAAIAICFLHSYRNPEHERRAAEIVRGLYPDVEISVSHEILQEYREYERTSTTVLDAYIRPVFAHYVDRLEDALRERGFAGRFLIMRSGGGAMTAEQAIAYALEANATPAAAHAG